MLVSDPDGSQARDNARPADAEWGDGAPASVRVGLGAKPRRSIGRRSPVYVLLRNGVPPHRRLLVRDAIYDRL